MWDAQLQDRWATPIIQIQKLYFSHFFLINPRQKTARPLSLEN